MQPSCAARARARAEPLTEHCLRAQEALCAMDPAVAESLILLSSPDADLFLSEAALGDEVRWGGGALGRWGAGAVGRWGAGAAADAHTI